MPDEQPVTTCDARPLTVLYASNWMGTGGIETNLVLLTRELIARGHRAIVASSGGNLVPDLVAVGGRHVELPLTLQNAVQVARTATALARVVESERPDVIHTFSASTSFLTMLAATVARARLHRWPPVISSVMGMQAGPGERFMKSYLRCYATTWGARRTLVIAPAIGEMLRRTPVRPSRLRECQVVGIDRRFALRATAERVAALRAELGLVGRRVVTTIGNLEPRKSHELFIAAAARLAPRFPDVTFLIVGEGSLRPMHEAQIRELGLEGTVRLLGRRADTPELLGLTTVYVKPGVVEGFAGITVLEAQLVDRPVVAFDTQDVGLAITHGKTGLIAERGNVEALADEIGDLLSDPQRAAAIARAGREHVIATFSIEAVVDQLLAQYRDVINH